MAEEQKQPEPKADPKPPPPPPKPSLDEQINALVIDKFSLWMKLLSVAMSIVEAFFSAFVAHEVAHENIPSWARVSMHLMISLVLIIASLSALALLTKFVIETIKNFAKYKPMVGVARVVLGFTLFGMAVWAMYILPVLQFLLVANGYQVTQEVLAILYSGNLLNVMTVKSMGTAAAFIVLNMHYAVYVMMGLEYGLKYLKPEPPPKPPAKADAKSETKKDPESGGKDEEKPPKEKENADETFVPPVYINKTVVDPMSMLPMLRGIVEFKNVKVQKLTDELQGVAESDRPSKKKEIEVKIAEGMFDQIIGLAKAVFNLSAQSWEDLKPAILKSILSGNSEMEIQDSNWITSTFNTLYQSADSLIKKIEEKINQEKESGIAKDVHMSSDPIATIINKIIVIEVVKKAIIAQHGKVELSGAHVTEFMKKLNETRRKRFLRYRAQTKKDKAD